MPSATVFDHLSEDDNKNLSLKRVSAEPLPSSGGVVDEPVQHYVLKVDSGSERAMSLKLSREELLALYTSLGEELAAG